MSDEKNIDYAEQVDFNKEMEAYEKMMKETFDRMLKMDWKYTFVNSAKMHHRTLEEQIGRYIALGVMKEYEDYYNYTKTIMLSKKPQGLPS